MPINSIAKKARSSAIAWAPLLKMAIGSFLNEVTTHMLYQLDGQETAGKFRDKKVKVTGTLDVVKNLIRIQSIAEAAA